MQERIRLRYTTYLACAIEHAINNPDAHIWKQLIKQELGHPTIGIYDPIEMESLKTGKTSDKTCDYISNLKRAGHIDQFKEEMTKIWWGNIRPFKNKIKILEELQRRGQIDGNYREEMLSWGDNEAVVRSDFIIAYIEKDVATIGTIKEIHLCYLFNIPVYLILPDQTKTNANSTLLDMVLDTKGEVFYNTKDCVSFIKEKYKI